jgi:hypothetical protein
LTIRRPSRLRCRLIETKPGWRAHEMCPFSHQIERLRLFSRFRLDHGDLRHGLLLGANLRHGDLLALEPLVRCCKDNDDAGLKFTRE